MDEKLHLELDTTLPQLRYRLCRICDYCYSLIMNHFPSKIKLSIHYPVPSGSPIRADPYRGNCTVTHPSKSPAASTDMQAVVLSVEGRSIRHASPCQNNPINRTKPNNYQTPFHTTFPNNKSLSIHHPSPLNQKCPLRPPHPPLQSTPTTASAPPSSSQHHTPSPPFPAVPRPPSTAPTSYRSHPSPLPPPLPTLHPPQQPSYPHS